MRSKFLLYLAGIGAAQGLEKPIWGDCFGTECFRILGPEMSYEALKGTCSQIGGVLFSTDSLSVMEHVQSLYEKKELGTSLYIGATYFDGEITFESNNTKVGFLKSRPDLEFPQCVVSKRDGVGGIYWEPSRCSTKEPTIYSYCHYTIPEHGFCYEIRWQDEMKRQRRNILEPVTKYPPNHPKVKDGGICGKTIDRYITPDDYWSNSYRDDTNPELCEKMSGGEVFYGYNYPEADSSNTGFSEDNAFSMFFIVDTNYNGYWVVAIDKANGGDSDYGLLELKIDNDGRLEGKDVKVLLADDVMSEAAKDGLCTVEEMRRLAFDEDCYAWDSEKGKGSFIWKWRPCCTDGMVLGRLPTDDFCIDVQVGTHEGLEKANIGHFNHQTNSIELSEIPMDSPFQVCGYTCPDFCQTITDCGECAINEQCGWCPGSGCMAVGAKATCSAPGWKDQQDACCGHCSPLKTCAACSQEAGCGWNSETRTCESGSHFSRELCTSGREQTQGTKGIFAFSSQECPTPSPTDKPTTPTASTTGNPDGGGTPTGNPDGGGTPTGNPDGGSTPTGNPDGGSTPDGNPGVSPAPGAPNGGPPTVDTDDASANGGESGYGTLERSGNNDGSWIVWGIPVIIILCILFCCCCWFLIIPLICRRREDEDDEDADIANFENPMHNNDLVPAILAKKETGKAFRVYTNNPNIAMILSKNSKCFVKCTDDEGLVIDKFKFTGRVNTLVRNLTAEKEKKTSPKVGTHLKVRKNDEWTVHTDPATMTEYFYNGKLNKVAWEKGQFRVTHTPKHDPLRWEFAPDEFDGFAKFVNLLRKDAWKKHEDLHIDYYLNPHSNERVWIE